MHILFCLLKLYLEKHTYNVKLINDFFKKINNTLCCYSIFSHINVIEKFSAYIFGGENKTKKKIVLYKEY